MTHLPSELSELFDECEKEPKSQVVWFRIAGAIHEIAKGREEEAVFEGFKREWMAMYFLPNDPHSSEHWGTHFGPTSVLQNSDGQWTESPSIQSVDVATLDYWMKRAVEAKHPELRSRYADLAWDLGHKVDGYKRPIEALRVAVDGYLEAARTVTESKVYERMDSASRAMDLATQVSDTARIEEVVNCILSLAAETDEVRAWRFAGASLLGNAKLRVSEEQQEQVVAAMVRHSDVELEPEGILPFQGGEISLDLAEHYWVTNEREAAQALARRYSQACLPTCREAMAMMACGWLTKLENLLTRYELKDDAREVAVLLEERSAGIRENMATTEHRQEIDMRPFNELIDKMLDRTMAEAMAVYWQEFLPSLKSVEELAKSSHTGFLASFFGRVDVDHTGRATRVLPSYRENPEAYTELTYVENIGYSAFFLGHAVERFMHRFEPDVDELLEALEASPLFGEHNRVVVKRGLQAYLDDDHVCAAHVLVPAIEAALRLLLSGLGQATWKTPRRGNSQERHVLLLHEILVQPAIAEYFGPDATKYLHMLLSDPKGWNVRNNVSHGLVSGFGPMLSDRLFHVLLGLGCVRPNPEQGASSIRC